jgi:hypothetical protein
LLVYIHIATIHVVGTVEVHITVNNITVLGVAQQYFMANSCFYLGLYVKCSISLSGFNQVRSFLTDFA